RCVRQLLRGTLRLADQAKALCPLPPVFCAAAVDNSDFPFCHRSLLFALTKGSPHWRPKQSRSATRPPEAAGGGTEMRQHFGGTARPLRRRGECYTRKSERDEPAAPTRG